MSQVHASQKTRGNRRGQEARKLLSVVSPHKSGSIQRGNLGGRRGSRFYSERSFEVSGFSLAQLYLIQDMRTPSWGIKHQFRRKIAAAIIVRTIFSQRCAHFANLETTFHDPCFPRYRRLKQPTPRRTLTDI